MCSLNNQYVHNNGLRFELDVQCNFFFFFLKKRNIYSKWHDLFSENIQPWILHVYSIIKIDGCCIEHKWCLQCICKYNLNLKTCIFTFLSERVLVNYHRIIMFTDLRYIMQLILRKIGWNNRISEEKCFYLYNTIWLRAKQRILNMLNFFFPYFFFFLTLTE